MTETGPAPDATGPRRRARLVWRAVFVLYLVALTTATHWPNLEIVLRDEAGDRLRLPDKVVHVVVFAMLLLLLRQTGLVRRWWTLALVGVAWAGADEATQALPGLGREVSLQDVAASLLGVATALICLWALAPIGGPANHARLEMRSMALDDMVGRPRAWGLIALGGLVGALLVGPVVYFVAPSLLVAGRLDSIVLGAVVGGAFGAHASMEAQRRRTVDRLCAARGCLHCGVSCAEATIDAAGRGTCPACGAPLWVGQWRTRLALTRDRALHLLVRPAALVAVMWVLLGVAYFASMVLHTKFAPVTAFNRLWFETLTPGFRTGVDVTILVLSAAIGVRLYRGRLAVIIDRQHRTCVRCRHDLQGTPTRSGMGRCGECALPFFVPLEDR